MIIDADQLYVTCLTDSDFKSYRTVSGKNEITDPTYYHRKKNFIQLNITFNLSGSFNFGILMEPIWYGLNLIAKIFGLIAQSNLSPSGNSGFSSKDNFFHENTIHLVLL